ncbi:MAG: hypothetical protein ACLQBK_26195 [Candidatus Sulfotelmatobacter sp.]
MAHTRKSSGAALRTDAVFKEKMTTVHTGLDAVAKKRHDAVMRLNA